MRFGASDFGFVSDFEFRISDFLQPLYRRRAPRRKAGLSNGGILVGMEVPLFIAPAAL